MIEWIDITDSKRVTAVAYDSDEERILVRFPGGIEWQYNGCPTRTWDEFMAPGQSKGQYIDRQLNHHNSFSGSFSS